jgi:hypothetical protein
VPEAKDLWIQADYCSFTAVGSVQLFLDHASSSSGWTTICNASWAIRSLGEAAKNLLRQLNEDEKQKKDNGFLKNKLNLYPLVCNVYRVLEQSSELRKIVSVPNTDVSRSLESTINWIEHYREYFERLYNKFKWSLQ